MKSRLLTTLVHYQAASKLKNCQNAAGRFGVLFFGMQHLPICSVCVCVCVCVCLCVSVCVRTPAFMCECRYVCTDPPYTHARTHKHTPVVSDSGKQSVCKSSKEEPVLGSVFRPLKMSVGIISFCR